MTKLKNITRISYKRDPEKGERGAIPRVSTWQPMKTYFAGAEGETFVDFVYYDGLYYRCTNTHTSTSKTTPYASINTLKDGKWDIESNFELIATKVAFVGDGGEGWVIDNGEITHTSGLISLSKDGSIVTSNGRYTVDNTGKLICEEAEIADSTLTNVKVQGTLCSPFVLWDSTANSFEGNDNVVVPITSLSTEEREITSSEFTWSASNSGRIIRFVNYKWNGTTAQGKVILKAPSGKYFYENGKARTQIIVSRECLVLLGYGTPSTFYGWIVLARVDVYTNGTYGSPLKVIYQGVFNPTQSIPLEKLWSEKLMHTGIKESNWGCEILDSNGKYRIWLPEQISVYNWHVMLTPCAYGVSAAITTNVRYATLMAKGSGNFTCGDGVTRLLSYFDVWTADDSSVNPGGFLFQVISMADWATPSS
ncbi:MAG: hypothetical protein IKK89_07840 [Alistipes sp.]|nr:hypothetical protein [Alistipes sp.]